MLDSDIGLGDYVQMLRDTVDGFVRFSPVLEAYIKAESDQMGLGNVIVPSTLLTSIWTILILVSGIISQLLLPVDYVRRFATWWFRDVERQPLTVIAKVAATLIILGAMVIKAVRWIY